ncbi:MAG: glycosyltransferase family 2 protein [Verrucomicrobia bacterium]|nr:glycosyltransferase family 2 protein [Verrucomicrobiota bacterium]
MIPTRNEAEDILATLEAIRANTDGDHETLVVDGSDDETPNMVRNFGDPRFRLAPQDNRDGRCGARNQGIRMARGEVVVIPLLLDPLCPRDRTMAGGCDDLPSSVSSILPLTSLEETRLCNITPQRTIHRKFIHPLSLT